MTMDMQDVIQQGEYIEQIDWMCEQIKDHQILIERIIEQVERLTKKLDDDEVRRIALYTESRVNDLEDKMDWVFEQIEKRYLEQDILIRRVDELFPDRMNHHLRLLKLEEAHEQS